MFREFGSGGNSQEATVAGETFASQQKLTWRGWAWNELARRGAIADDILVLYMPGPEDRERPQAIAKGFKPYNLIAIDSDQKVINKVRAAGGLGICGEAENICMEVATRRLRFSINFDFLGGLTRRNFLACLCCLSEDCIASVVNCLRGRDQKSNILLSVVNPKLLERLVSRFVNCRPCIKHRGFLLFNALCGYVRDIGVHESFGDWALEAFEDVKFYSYRSKNRSHYDSMAAGTFGLRVRLRCRPKPMFHKVSAMLARRTVLMQEAGDA